MEEIRKKTDIFYKKDIEELGYGTHLYAETSCRTDANFLDFTLALHDCNGSIKELLEYASKVDELPFAKRLFLFLKLYYKPIMKKQIAIPPFPIRAAEVKQITVDENDSSRPDYVPSYLPPFPGKHTYIFTPVNNLTFSFHSFNLVFLLDI